MWRGGKSYESESEVRTLSGDVRQTIMRWSVPPGGDGSYSTVLVSMPEEGQRLLGVVRDNVRQMAHLIDTLSGVFAHRTG